MSAKPTANARSRPRKKHGGLGLRWLAIATMTLFGVLLLSWGFSSNGAPHTESRPSSHAAASPRARYETRAIRDIRTGHRVMADNPELADEDVPQEAITPETHRNLVFRQSKRDGSLVEFELIRSLDWIAWTGAEAGRTVELDLNEFGVEGPAEVLDVQPCPNLEHGPGRLVTGIFRHTAHNVIDVYIADLDEAIGVTANHPFWSEHRQTFIAASDLRPGESVLQADGQAGHVIRVTSTPRTETVHNIEVEGEHAYYVSDAGVLVHNTCVNTNFHGYAIYDGLTGEVLKFGVSRGKYTKLTEESIRARAQLTRLAGELNIPRERLGTVVLREFTSKDDMFKWERQTVGFFRKLWDPDALPFNKLPHGEPF